MGKQERGKELLSSPSETCKDISSLTWDVVYHICSHTIGSESIGHLAYQESFKVT